MNDLFSLFELQAWKPVLASLLLPPVPMLATTLLGAGLLARRRRIGWWLILGSAVAIWLSGSAAAAHALGRAFGLHPAALSTERLQAIADGRQRHPERPASTAVLVLGGGREAHAPEYHGASLSDASLQRLRHGIWLGRATGVPVGFSGGVGWAQVAGEPEAEIAARIAVQEFRYPLRWVEGRSRDTGENARLALAMLRADGVRHVLLVTHGWHMRRALRAFEAAARPGDPHIEPAPMGLATPADRGVLGWMPSSEGLRRTRDLVREQLGWWMGA